MFDLLQSPAISPKRAVTIACQRSGTKFLGDCLNAGDLGRSFGEVMNPDWARLESNMINYASSNSRFIFGMKSNQIYTFLDDYFLHLDSLCDRQRFPHVDIMYNNLGGLTSVWSYPSPSSLLLRYFFDRGFFVIHIIRESLFDAFVSSAVSQRRRVAHTTNAEVAADAVEVTLDLGSLRNFVSLGTAAREFVRQCLGGYDRYGEIRFPDFIDGNTVSPWLVSRGDDERVLFGVSELKKTTDRRSVTITNEAAALQLVEELLAQGQKT